MCELAWRGLARERHVLCELVWHVLSKERHVACESIWHVVANERNIINYLFNCIWAFARWQWF